MDTSILIYVALGYIAFRYITDKNKEKAKKSYKHIIWRR